MAATLADVARKVGCSSATVSRVLNGIGQVSRPMREAVLEAARSVDYRAPSVRRSVSLEPSRTERGLIEVVMHRRSPYERLSIAGGALGVEPLAAYGGRDMLSDSNRLSNSFERRIVDGLIEEASAWSHRVELRASSDLESEKLLAEVNASSADGVVLMGEYSENMTRFVSSCRRPLVLVDLIADRGPPVVTIDNARGIADAFAHLRELGHKKIGFLAGPRGVAAFNERRRAFLVNMVDAGLTADSGWIYEGSQHMVHTAAWVDKVLARKSRPTALMCCNDFMALAALKAAADRNLAVPGKLSVVGFDDIEPAPLVTPSLTTVHVPTHEMGRQAVRQMMLQTRAARPASGIVVRVAPALVVRDSTGRAPG